MKIIYKVGDLLEASERTIAHGCNAQGRMGKGVAKLIRDKWPHVHKIYEDHYNTHGLRLGEIVWAKAEPNKMIANCITQEFFKEKDDGLPADHIFVSYEAIEETMWEINRVLRYRNSPKVALPKIGAGLANGDWNKIAKIIELEFKEVQPVVYVLNESEIP